MLNGQRQNAEVAERREGRGGRGNSFWTLCALCVLCVWPLRCWAGSPDVFTYDIVGDVDSLDPHWAYDGVSDTVVWQTYENLVFYRGPSVRELDPMLATAVPTRANALVSADGRRYTFPIRKGVLFHDGTPLTPEDVKYSLMRFLLMDRSGGGSGLLLRPVLGVETTRGENGKPRPGLFEEADQAIRVEGQAVVVELREPFAPFLYVLASHCPVVSKAWTAGHGGWDGKADSWPKFNDPAKESSYLHDHVNGTGPFQLESWDKAQKRVVLARNARYWRGPAKLKRVVLRTVDESNTRRLHVAAGDSDAILMERQYLPQVERLPGVTVEDGLPLLEVQSTFVFNLRINPSGNPDIFSGRLDGEGIPPNFFSDVEVRRGFANAFDYEGFIKAGYRGKAQRARGPIPAGMFGYDANVAVPNYDPAKAVEHFRRAWGGRVWDEGFRFTVSFMQGRADRQLACQILKKNVETLNPKFRIEVRPLLWSTMLSQTVAGKLPMMNARWGIDYPDAHNAVHAFMHSEGYYAKAMSYGDARTDRLIDGAARELEPDRRIALYRELQALAAIDVPAVFTVDGYQVRVYRDDVKGWWYNPILPTGYLYPVYKEAR